MLELLDAKTLVTHLKDPMVAQARAFVSTADDQTGSQALTPVLVDLTTITSPLPSLYQPACPVIGVGTSQHLPEVVDVIVDEGELDHVVSACQHSPQAATVLVQLLRHNERANVQDGLLAESLASSTLQHGATFLSWLNARPESDGISRASEATAPPLVVVERDDDHLHLSLNRPSKHNAYSAAMRDELCNALQMALLDDRLSITLDGNGPSFSAGGDLSEFGLANDAGVAHVARTAMSAAWMIHQLRSRLTVVLHGACIGAGIELPAFAAHVVAKPDARFRLPEVGFGLVPGAGGTVSVTRRIGRHKTARLALMDETIDASTALEWGLIDRISG
jgi:hypothetical protein